MERIETDILVIGGGSGGLSVAAGAVQMGARVVLLEGHKMGGDCLNYGCVPSKALLASAAVAHGQGGNAAMGVDPGRASIDYGKAKDFVASVIGQIAPHDSVARYTSLGVEVVQGHATLCNPWTVEIKHPDGSLQRLSARSIVIAAGARPVVPALPGLAEAGYVTSDTLWARFATLTAAPKRLLVLGGGPIGCELAQSFARLGSQVTLVEQAPRLLLREDEEVSALVTAALRADGVRVLTGHTALRCETANGADAQLRTLVVSQDGQETALPFDELLCAVGRVVESGRQITLRLTSTHAHAAHAQALLTNLSLFLSGLKNTAEQLIPSQCWIRNVIWKPKKRVQKWIFPRRSLSMRPVIFGHQK